MSNDIKDNIKQQSTWIRGLYMVLFSIFYTIADFVLFAVIVFQFVLKLFTGGTNDRLRKLGLSISTYIYEILQFLSFNSEQHPYPFGTWPKGESRVAEPKVEEPKSEQAKPQEPSVPKEIKAVAKKAAPPKKAKKE
jgi:hypothetical protein